jgi:hypothetical protein
MNILIIPEDFRNDQYILEPIIRSMLAELNRPRAKIRVCRDPLLGGVAQALKWERIFEIIERYKGMVDLFLLCVDRDGEEGRRQALDKLENEAKNILPNNKKFLAENAWQEVEVWVLAGHTLPKKWVWKGIRQETNPKEVYFLPFAQQRGLLNEPGGGRKTLALEAAKQYKQIRQHCREDVLNLENRIRQFLNSTQP